MSNKSIAFHNVSPAGFNCMKKKLQDLGVSVPPGNKGELSGQGVAADFEWDGESKLIVTIKKKPFIISYETAAWKISEFVKECQGTLDKIL